MTERLTLSEAIKHCEEKTDCTQCGEGHRQLAEWLRKLQSYEDLGFTPEDIIMMAKFYKEQTSVEAITANMKLVQRLIKLENYETLEKEGRLIIKPAEEELLEDNV